MLMATHWDDKVWVIALCSLKVSASYELRKGPGLVSQNPIYVMRVILQELSEEIL